MCTSYISIYTGGGGGGLSRRRSVKERWRWRRRSVKGGGLSREEVCQGGGLSRRSVKVEEVCQGALEVEEEGVSDLEGSEHRAGRAGRKTGGRV